jgi:hypothetical protein
MSNHFARIRRGMSVVGGGLALVMVAVLAMAAAPASADSVIGQTPGLRLNGVGCANGSALNCVAVGGSSFSGNSGGEFVALKNGVAASRQTFPAGFIAFGVGCPSAASCVVVGSTPGGQFGREGALVNVTDGVPGAIQLVPSAEGLRGVECDAAGCLAVGQGALAFGSPAAGVVVSITHGSVGSGEQVPGVAVLEGVACRSAGDCVAVGEKLVAANGIASEQAVTVAVTNGSPGSPQSVPNTTPTSFLHSVACPAGAAGCVAVGENFANGNTPGPGMVVPISGSGAPGSPRLVAGTSSLTTVVCTSATDCLAGGDRTGGGGGQTTGVLAAVNINGSPGAAHDQTATEQVDQLACADASHCVYTGYTGHTAANSGTGLIFALGQAGPGSNAGAALAKSLTPSGPAARISAILRSGGFPAPFTAPVAGSVTITWYYLPAGAKLARVVKPVVVARGSKTFAGPGHAKVKLRLTAQGRKLLTHAKRVKLIAAGTFVPKHGKKSSRRKSITLK